MTTPQLGLSTSILTLILLSALPRCESQQAGQPNIVLILADDLGWNDVGFHGSNQIPTPNLDALAYNGIIFNSHYTQSTCTPSRTALLTGKYPMRLGMHGTPLNPAQVEGLPEGKLLPEYLKELGYETHLVGKWHLGYARWNNTPTYRGFDHHLGYYTGYVSYYDYLNTFRVDEKDYTGYDLRRDTEVAWDLAGQYATDVFTDHAVKTIENHALTKPLFLMVSHLAVHAGNDGKLLEAPQETINKFRHIQDSNRRTYAAMVSKLDDSVGSIVSALQAKGLLENTILVFASDNGAPTVGQYSNWGSNYPLRGIKATLFEGGIRGVAFAWSPLFVQSGRVSADLIHISDWLPTLFTAAGGDIGLLDPDLDGVDQWSSLQYDLPSPRNDILINIDEITRNAALRFYNWKLIVGTTWNGTYDSYFGESGKENIEEQVYNSTRVFDSPAGKAIRQVSYTSLTEAEYEALRRQATLRCLNAKAKRNPCDPSNGEVCLYDVPSDPCEENNLASFLPSVVRRMKRALVDYRSGLTPQISGKVDIEKDDPKLFQFAWNPWLDCSDSTCAAA
ncbi:PREDICTED: arylsulfatase B-like [Nicrophorus vespilloides]|uniref:Arylsulfatase B-like n=1 Tax=Nicrophorus vespilloides TaxID=110193 RepID=A0ABM1M5P1_NICVS|nr:PREDICTED: arylsulfatase B-like [Nicrophorus vespilloides]